jgi:glucose/arabinose dehydrogenase
MYERFYMKKVFLFVVLLILVIGSIVGGHFIFTHRGALPAMRSPSIDITEVLPSSSASSEESTNTTGTPLTMPNGFTISIFAKNLGDARVMAWDPDGTLLVSNPGKERVVALIDTNGDGISENTIPVVQDLNKPHGIAFHKGKLYVAEVNQVAIYDYDAKNKKATNKKKILDLPAGGNHTSRSIAFGPDGKLYISVGSSCNACVEKDTHRAAISVANADGSDYKIFAAGLRNAVFFTWSPFDNRMWATNMGRDLIGDDIPPETVNIVTQGKNFGWPYCYGKRVWDKSFDSSKKAQEFCGSVEPPHIEYQAHSAPLGLAFIPKSWPQQYQNDLLVAFHGSWNRTQPTGYKVVRFNLDDEGNYLSAEDFISGWLQGSGAIGRPVDLTFDANGVLYISDDKAGVIYRVSQK